MGTETSGSRVESIDLLRGIVMIIMALDHTRDYFHFDAALFSPTDLERTTPALFATRFLTHLCAPAFIFLAGTSGYFIANQKTVRQTSMFLFSRGLWLVFFQLTVIRFAWHFDPEFHYNGFSIISTIGFCMITLALLIHLRMRIILAFSLVLVVGHNSLDNITFESGTVADIAWSFLHAPTLYTMGHGYAFQFLYPLIPWVGVMGLGYCFGHLYDSKITIEERRRLTMRIGILSFATFIFLRLVNIYGDPKPWTIHDGASATIMSFFNLQKYPPSLLFLCVTLGVILISMSYLDGRNNPYGKPIALFGKVALFYYVVHIVVIHSFALASVVAKGYPWQTMFYKGSQNNPSPLLGGRFGFSLFQVYLIWVIIILYFIPHANTGIRSRQDTEAYGGRVWCN